MRVVVLTGPGLDDFQQSVLAPFLAAGSEHTIAAAAIDARPAKPLGEKLRANLRRGRGGYVLVMALRALRRRAPGAPGTVDARLYFEARGIAVCETVDPYASRTVEAIREFHPDVLVLLGGYGILREPLLSLAPRGVLSYHHGDMRRYRGMPPALWELYHGEREMGMTVQRLSAALDAGEPIVERTVAVRRDDTVSSLRARAFAHSTDMLYDAVSRVSEPDFTPARIEALGPVYTLPNLRQWLLLGARVGGRLLRARFARRQGESSELH